MSKQIAFYCKVFHCVFIWLFQMPLPIYAWGFFAHKQINRYAITTLPPGMFRFYKAHLVFLTEKSVAPDQRRYIVADEASKHYIDLEMYSLHAEKNNLSFHQAIEEYGHKMVIEHGQLPWAILEVHKQLTAAFIKKDQMAIMRLSAQLGHYIADAHVPLHTTQNYNGQMSDQEGIHALWETRLPILFWDTYNLFVGQTSYIQDPLFHIWTIISASHDLVDKVLTLEKQLSKQYPAMLKYSYELEGSLIKKQYAIAFSTAYHQALQGQVEERIRASIIQVGNFWFTAWINAGKPDLDNLLLPSSAHTT